ncbi:MAG: HEAT repeat domain-containing protein [Gammaproteobacteria bacterium]|nr:HEAT repeat domain-containing protein [Gammaproteobacteria bacterium]MDH5240364.1 HEAT repeat domain-containing protein [Gammaproteobacteria bacterium]MDH5260584.1 HEAT repeat domain-containing protein [Gammaproteobacteria bacterium]MDH5583080.1 HEAT repeat domain-containing protein [Gammaproteobacteria bacterium]
MSIFASFLSDQLLGKLIAEQDPSSPAAQKLIEKLKTAGNKAIPKIIDALALSDKSHTMVLVDILGSMVNDKNLDVYREGLADGNERVVSGTSWALSSSTAYNANGLLDFFSDPEVSKAALIDILRVHKQDLSVHELLRHAYECEPKEKAAIFKIIQETIKPEMVPDLVARMGGRDPVIKIHLMQLLAKFDKEEITHAFEMQLSDPNKMVRGAALAALATRKNSSISIEKVAKVLLDPDLDVQGKAVDVLIKLNHPDTVRYLLPALKDESEYTRRAAVEVLNEVGNESSIKELLTAIKDDDWWVRSRAGDALAEIGGPRVVDAVVSLISSPDEEIRRTAIEILNSTKDERAIDGLLRATDDTDWWVRERAVDALSKIGSPKALPKLESMLGANPKTDTVVVRALGKLGNAKHLAMIVPLLQRPEREIQVEAIKALSLLADETHAESIRGVLRKIQQSEEHTIINAADTALKSLDDRYSRTVVEENIRAEKIADNTKTLLVDNEDLEKLLKQAKEASAVAHADGDGDIVPAATTAPVAQMSMPVLDISQLNPGDIIDGRYKYIEKIGKGAFGTVLLMHDEVVDEQLILKFLNPNVSSDEEMMKRFVHELRYSRKITHRNVIRIYDFLHLQGAYAISMEYFPSHTLSGEIPDSKPMDLAKALRFSKDMATGMNIAHQAGVIHRDLKPANILVNNEGLLKIVDFGVAAAASSGDTQLTKTGYVIGSPKYMAPEQILGKKVDETADIYSIGVIMYEMVTGVPPYSRGDHMSVMYQHVQGKAKHCQEINPLLPDDYANLIVKAMSVDKTKRYQSMDELTEALNKLDI